MEITLIITSGRDGPGLFFEGQMMRKFLNLIVAILASFRHKPTSRRNLLGMYFGETNSTGRHKPNRDRA